MGWVGFGVFACASMVAFATGDRLGRAGRRVRAAGAGALLVLLLVAVGLHHAPTLAERLFPLATYVRASPWAPAVLGVGFLSAAIPQLPAPATRRALGLFASVLFLFVLQRAAASALQPLDDYRGVPDPELGVCPQTTSFSCGAAAAATLLARLGVETTESEMADRCATNLFTGTADLGVLLGVREKLAGTAYTADLVPASTEALRAVRLPVAVNVTRGPFLGHWLVVVARDGEMVTLADPRTDAAQPSLREESFAVLAAELRGWMIRVRPRAQPPRR